MPNLLTKARNGRANALKSLTENRVDGTTFVMSSGRRHARPSKASDALIFTSVRSDDAPKAVFPVTAARIKAEKAFLAATMPQAMQGSLVH